MIDEKILKMYNISTILVPYEIPDMKDFNGMAFVAECPGADEEEQEKPLVGVSGKKFDGWLKEAGIKRKQSIIANTFRYRPNDNKIDHYFCSDRIAKEQEIEVSTLAKGKCRGKNLIGEFDGEIKHLVSSIVKYKPKVVIPMGGIATWALIGLDKITSIQGKVFKKTFEHKGKKHTCTILPCFHPSSALANRSPQNEEEIIKVFKAAKKLVR